jgi:hypothetical protein
MDARNHGSEPGPAAPELAHYDLVALAPRSTAAARALKVNIREKAPDAANVEGPVRTRTSPPILAQTAYVGKRFATLRAQLALKGYCLSRTDGDDGPVYFHVSRWDMVRELRDLAAVARFLDQVGGAHA